MVILNYVGSYHHGMTPPQVADGVEGPQIW